MTGESAICHVPHVFRWRKTPFVAGGTPWDTLLLGLVFWFRDVPKASLTIPLSRRLVGRRRLSRFLTAIVLLAAIATVAALLISQHAIDGMPKGPRRSSLNAWLVPAIAVGGWIVIASAGWGAYHLAPRWQGLTTLQITDTHVYLEGVAADCLATLPELDVQH